MRDSQAGSIRRCNAGRPPTKCPCGRTKTGRRRQRTGSPDVAPKTRRTIPARRDCRRRRGVAAGSPPGRRRSPVRTCEPSRLTRRGRLRRPIIGRCGAASATLPGAGAVGGGAASLSPSVTSSTSGGEWVTSPTCFRASAIFRARSLCDHGGSQRAFQSSQTANSSPSDNEPNSSQSRQHVAKVAFCPPSPDTAGGHAARYALALAVKSSDNVKDSPCGFAGGGGKGAPEAASSASRSDADSPSATLPPFVAGGAFRFGSTSRSQSGSGGATHSCGEVTHSYRPPFGWIEGGAQT